VNRLVVGSALVGLLLSALASADTHTPKWVLINGLTNVHQWSDPFLREAAKQFGGGNVVVVPTNTSRLLSRRSLGGRTVTTYGRNDVFSAGMSSLAAQSAAVTKKIRELRQRGVLGDEINIIGHSMGGLVARDVAAELNRAGSTCRVRTIVTLGTPHHGSPLANSLVLREALGRLIGAHAAMDDLRPAAAAAFNRAHPASGSGAAIYTIRGCSDGLSAGALGECHAGYELMRWLDGTPSDGLVPSASARLRGATHLGSFDGRQHTIDGQRVRLPKLDHYGLVRDPSVIQLIARELGGQR
jgi:triacylglycerol lipase